MSSGVWCIITLEYFLSEDQGVSPWIINEIKPIQISHFDINEYKEGRKQFSKDEWIDVLMQTIGLNPEEFTFRSKLIQLSRLIPFAENNYNLIELGPKGTGKSHIYSEFSPHGILISGGEVTKAKLFVNNTNGDIGLVGYWDAVAYDEFAGKSKRVDKGLVDIMKNYMANKSFSRGTEVFGATASMVFVGNTDHSVPYMLKHSDLFESLPKEYYDSAFLDRIHIYLPGWEVSKLRNEMFTSNYGFIVDYLAEVLREFRKDDYTHEYKKYFDLSDSITTRDKDAIAKTFSGLIKVIFPHGEYTESEAKEILDFAIEGRKRVKEQLIKMDETFEEVDFSYKESSGKLIAINTLEVKTYLKPTLQPDNTIKEDIKEKTKPLPEASQIVILDNQIGISYNSLFQRYLDGATEIEVIDPFIRMAYQMRNFMEFCQLVASIKEVDQEVKIKLLTYNIEEYIEDAKHYFNEMRDSLEEFGVYLEVEMKDSIHDRSIITNNGWKIILGRGLDIYQKTNGCFDLAEYDQSKRKCKACEITFLRE